MIKIIKESYSYDNQRIMDILDKIEFTNDDRKINKAYDFVNHACSNIDDCIESGFYDLSEADWAYGTDYIIEELTDILNESIRRVLGRKLHEYIDWTEDIDAVLKANKDYVEKIVYTDDWDVTNWDPESKDKVLGKIRVRRASKDRAVWQYLGYTHWDDNILIINDKKEADSLSELFDYIADFPVNHKKPSWKVRVFLPERFNESIQTRRKSEKKNESIRSGRRKNRMNESLNGNKMVIKVSSGISADGFSITVLDNQDNVVFKNSYSYGYNASHDRKYTEFAHNDVVNAKKYGWKGSYTEQPYVTDIINDLLTKYNIDKEDIEVTSGRNTFRGQNVDSKDVDRFVDKYISQL